MDLVGRFSSKQTSGVLGLTLAEHRALIQRERRVELQRLGVDDAAVRTPRVIQGPQLRLSHQRPRVSASPLDLAKARALDFTELVAAKTAGGMTASEALVSAGAEDPDGYRDYVGCHALAKDGTMLASSPVRATVQPLKPIAPAATTQPSARAEIERRIEAEIAATGVNWSIALERVLSAAPQLYAAYRDQMGQQIDGVANADLFRQAR